MFLGGNQIETLRREVEKLRESIPSLAIYGQPLFSPPLWNDGRIGVSQPLPPVGKLMADENGGFFTDEILRLASRELIQPLQDALSSLGWEAALAEAESDHAPLPVAHDRQGYFGDAHALYWLSGLADRQMLLAAAAKYGRSVTRFLDFGASSGRVLRHFPRARVAECFGAEIRTQDVEWARLYLPDVTIVQGLSCPPLPFEDGYFDLIHAGSVFTHIAEFEEAWLCELRRVLKPGGIAYLTIHPERIWSELANPEHFITRYLLAAPHRIEPAYRLFTIDDLHGPMPAGRVVFRLLTFPINNTNVIHSDSWIAERWGRIFEILERIPNAHGQHQDAIVLQKR